YISGKGLKCPPELPEPYASELAMVRAESNHQVKEMCFKLNSLLEEVNAGFTLDYQILLEDHTKGQMRERHLAKFLRMSAYIHLKNEPEAIKAFFQNLFGGKPLQSDVYDYAAVENEIRGKLLKAGGAAFVPEDSKAFLPLEDVRKIIIAAGGIPTYPFLADDANGKFTDFERDVEQAAATLKDKGFYSVEFITTRNSMDVLEKYAEYLYNQGFIVTFGTEHNTPAMEPVKLSVRGGNELSDLLKQINYEGACVIAAHQHLIAEGKDGYIVKTGIPNPDFNRQQLIDMGHEIIKKIID
ncbi:MAG: hypothetical protein LBD53_10370, partial [Tannerella sp.]|nr:hypothetical protein [Tannerella sp.]